MVEWFKAAVLKTAEGQLSEGSNPSSSAIFLFKASLRNPCKKQAVVWKINFPTAAFSFYCDFLWCKKWGCSLFGGLPSLLLRLATGFALASNPSLSAIFVLVLPQSVPFSTV